MDRAILLRRLYQGAVRNVSFNDVVELLHGLGFVLARVNGSHHIFRHPEILEMLNLQEVRGEVKPYQIRQLLRLVDRYQLILEVGR
ncbi:MAG: type II toxin-antitoxin system HicA family toxin [Dehalococcoidia bacterium]|nr:type II toxin-antitoxin system HicA family toxin [Dehalococcoidia bacterium]